MAKLVVLNDKDPDIGIVLAYTEPGTPDKAQGWRGKCTQCGWVMHRWSQNVAIWSAQKHVDAHPARI